ncbi:hypothetical protein [Actinomycetospora straminea]|uniref:Uncharacterized protein n=1 Tax=Actinomycetospora straminea TaxID=663607 RepID=A0ABP9E2W7_9PSEU|nr:hypothetical protein [Actinomycetospora straminea]MDD7931000.1 hypothetical protein [Actinomycetospora straminea]
MGRHDRHDTTSTPADRQAPSTPRRIALAVRQTIPTPPAPLPGADATTLTIRPFGAAGPTVVPGPSPHVGGDGPIPTAGPPARLSRRERRAAKHEEAERAALAARLSRAQRRNRQVAAWSTPAVPAPRSADPSSTSGPLDTRRAARPPGADVFVPTQRS